MATATIEALAGLQTIPLDRITPNPFNPRKHFEKAPLAELAESIKVHGVRQPVLVRPLGKNFQLVVGERRWRASKLAGKENIPAIVDPQLDDRSALEIMVIENLQREDVHPLDEALGYQCLMEQVCSKCGQKSGHKIDCVKANEVQEEVTVEAIAAKVGKSVGYVYARMKLLSLIPAAREGFQAGRITAGHAVLIARLQPVDQVKALGACFNVHDLKELKDNDPLKLQFGMIVYEEDWVRSLLPEKGLREWIQDNVNLRLKDVPWDLADAKLFPAAGACNTCQKRSTSNPALFAELAVKGEDTCFDAVCYATKREAFVKITLKTANSGGKATDSPMLQLSERSAYSAPAASTAVYRSGQWLPAKKGSCPAATDGIIVKGENAGQVRHVCVDPKCKEHKHGFGGATASRNRASEEDRGQEELKRHRAAIREKKQARARAVLCQEIVKSATAKLPVEFVREVALGMDVRGDEAEIISWLLGEKKPFSAKELQALIGKADGARLNQILIALVVTDQHLGSWNVNDKESRSELGQLAKGFGVKESGKILATADKAISAAASCRACGCTEEIPCQFWNGSKQVACSWVKGDETLCSNPKCKGHAALQTPAKAKASAKKGKA